MTTRNSNVINALGWLRLKIMDKIEKINNLKTKSPFKIFDIVIAAALITLAVLLIIFVPQKKGAYVEVYVDNKLVFKRSLNEDYETRISTNGGEHYNRIKIENGYVYVLDADCNDKFCINTGKTNTKNKPIICLPHNLKIEVIGSDDGDIVIY